MEQERDIAENATGGEKSKPRARPLSPDTIILETIVQIYFFSIVQFWRFSIWLAGEL